MPYLKAPNPCELNCMPHGERFYYRHKVKVVDGTRCNDETNDVCVDGKCQVSILPLKLFDKPKTRYFHEICVGFFTVICSRLVVI